MFPFAVRDLKVPLCFPQDFPSRRQPKLLCLLSGFFLGGLGYVCSKARHSKVITFLLCVRYLHFNVSPACPLWQLVSGSGDQLWCTMSHIWSCWWWSDLMSSRFTSRTRSDTCSQTSTSWVWDGIAQTQVLFQTPHTIVFYCIKSHS